MHVKLSTPNIRGRFHKCFMYSFYVFAQISKRAQRQPLYQCLFELLEIALVKAACKTLVY